MFTKHIHFIGIGGIGMSALARWCKAHGWRVTGSDAELSPITAALRREGIRIARLPKGTALVVRSKAIPPAHEELRAARKNGIPVLSYPELLGQITTASATTIAVAGTHGKSTTTALIALMLTAGGKNPTVIIGTLLREFRNSNFRAGSDNVLVVEADEYGRAFLHYSPSVAVITNVDREHLDIYPSLRDAQHAFLQFLGRVRHGGTLVLNRDNAPLRALAAHVRKLAAAHKCKILWYSLKSPIAREVRRAIRIPGMHNISNAVAAMAAARALGVPKKTALRALGKYRGAWRRMEYRGSVKWKVASEKTESSLITHHSSLRTLVFDDYAHHPTEIKATLAAFREKFPRSPLICVFQPHQALRLQKLFSDFVTAFKGADALMLLPTYHVAGRDRINPRFTAKTLTAAIQRKYPKKPVLYVANPKKIKSAVSQLITYHLSLITPHRSAVLAMMGAGNIVRYTDTLLRSNRE
ncbi:MAG: UDP-N-acetylmuramate--L-alanine ligase [Candidatus Liptonbacteria bacterium]|nr:UDP-N-acetylmuramate--L-alanine ligase [Candidatus Liptonbacteria bacterium]